MEPVARDQVLHAGTYNANVVAMSAALATLDELDRPGTYEHLERISSQLAKGIADIFDRAAIPVQVQRVGSFFQVYFSPTPIREYRDAAQYADLVTFRKLQLALRTRGVLIYPNGLGRWFLSTAHTNADIEATLNAIEDSLGEL
jgi:glutamate-1-semialdehyde 2,1-aminomutase